ncbi:hypothetical protein [Crateriforma conspicua]|nr:hypothetical protein [Crateriforma conspicua]
MQPTSNRAIVAPNYAWIAGAMLLMVGCTGDQRHFPPLERLEQKLSVTMPADGKVIGGTEPTEAMSLWLIISKDPLPLPESTDKRSYRSRRGRRPEGTPVPVTALLNLLAACQVPEEEVPTFTEQRGAVHMGQVGDVQFAYREASIEAGWLTAVEIHLADVPLDR